MAQPGAFLAARDRREAVVTAVLAHQAGRSVITLSLNIPGPDKTPPGCETLFARAGAALEGALGGAVVAGGGPSHADDVLGPFAIWHAGLDPQSVKRAAVAIEHGLAGGRLLDVDVYDASGRQVDRGSLDLPPRACLVCPEPAHECARLGRHTTEQVVAAAQALLTDAFLDALAAALVNGAREELALTPKPGLVDRRDGGSHPDLTFEAMSRSIDLLPAYFAELRLTLATSGGLDADAERGARSQPGGRAVRLIDLRACVRAGLRAEERMWQEVGTNAHRGYIFLAGLALLAASPVPRGLAAYRARIAALAADVLAAPRDGVAFTHGERLRRLHGLAGIHGEALRGLPAVFDHGLPALRRGWEAGWDRSAAAHYAMAVLMQNLEDSTAVHRCGLEGLRRLREDGRRIQAALESGDDHRRLLSVLNDEYRAMRLTMGGVADCLALSLAVEASGIWLPDGDSV